MVSFPKYCPVCDQTCDSKEEWTNHLLQQVHFNRPKDPGNSWMEGPPEVKKCSVFTLGKGPLNHRRILEYFSRGEKLVVDILYCHLSPDFGMIQFENQAMVKQLLNETGLEICIDGDKIRLKKAFNKRTNKLVTPTIAKEVVSKKKKVPKEAAKKKELPTPTMVSAEINVADPQSSEEKNCGSIAEEVVSKNKSMKKLTVEDKVKLEQGSLHNLTQQYTDLCSLVEIPPKEFQLVADLLERIKDVFIKEYPTVKVTLFRHWYLKLRNGGSNQLLVYLSQGNYQQLGMNHEDIQELLKSIGIYPTSCVNQNDIEAGIPYYDGTSQYAFELVTDGNFRAEVLNCHWAHNLLEFDTRARSLLTLVHFWARENGVTLAEDGIAKRKQYDAIPDPGALEWLCILFLIKEKVIPAPDEVTLKCGEAFQPSDGTLFIPFPQKVNDFINQWNSTKPRNTFPDGSKEYILDVLQLARRFFRFRTPLSELLYSFCEKKFERSVDPLMNTAARKLDLYLSTKVTNIAGADLKSLFQPDLLIPAPTKISIRLELEQMVTDVEKELKDNHQLIMNITCGCQLASGVCDGNPLRCHFSREVLEDELRVLSKEEMKGIRDTQQNLKKLFEAAGLANCNLIHFRSGHLMLLSDVDSVTGNDLFFFVDHDGLYGERKGKREVLKVNANMRQEMINKVESKGEFEHKWLLVEPFLDVGALGGKEDMTIQYEDFGGMSDFSIAPRFYFPEVQANRLVEYLCTFDPRVKPLLAVIFYWANVNHIRLGRKTEEGKTKRRMTVYERIGFAPEPAVLEWLVLYFLGSKKIVPSPHEVISRNPDESLLFDGVNVAFKVDPEHAREWRSRYKEKNEEKHVWNVYSLARQFFVFCHDLGKNIKKKPLVIDLKYFRCFPKTNRMKDTEDVDEFGKMIGVSVGDLRLINSEPMIHEGFYSRSEALTFFHPLHVQYGFAFCCDAFLESVCPKMGVMAERMLTLVGTYSHSRKNRKKRARLEMELDDPYDDYVDSFFVL